MTGRYRHGKSETIRAFLILFFFPLPICPPSPSGALLRRSCQRSRRPAPLAHPLPSMVARRTSVLLLCLLFLSQSNRVSAWSLNRSLGDRRLAAVELPSHPGFESGHENSDCVQSRRLPSSNRDAERKSTGGPLRIHMRRLSEVAAGDRKPGAASVAESALWDLHRIQTLRRRIADSMKHKKKTWNRRKPVEEEIVEHEEIGGPLMAQLESGLALGSGEYLADIFVGTPARHFSVIVDTGSDLNWLQCVPCHDCYEQEGPLYDPSLSSSHRHVPCNDARCALVSDPAQPCRNHSQPCPYFYWYGDRSNTTGDLALESFTLSFPVDSGTRHHRAEGVVFGCGHWNRGLFRGAAGLLGLGRGSLSFSSQLRPLSGGVFSYCLVDRNSDLSVSSKLVFGEENNLSALPDHNFTAFVAGKEDPADTFYYLGIKAVKVGGRFGEIPPETWELGPDGGGGTIIDSGTTLSYFTEPAYRAIRDEFVAQVNVKKGYPLVEGVPVLSPCFNVSGAGKNRLPEFGILFEDGAEWNFPQENYFILLEGDVACLAVLGTPSSSLSILGNYLQQNFHVVYDTARSRLGFARARCAEV